MPYHDDNTSSLKSQHDTLASNGILSQYQQVRTIHIKQKHQSFSEKSERLTILNIFITKLEKIIR